MRTLLLMLIAALSVQAATARELRRDTMPENFWGTWAPRTDACKEKDPAAILLSAKAYAGPAGSCAIDYVTEIPGRGGIPIYSARMRCPGSGAQAKKQTIANLIIRPEEGGQISAGPTFEKLVAHRRCAADAPAKQQ
jgi:hypothetical protein